MDLADILRLGNAIPGPAVGPSGTNAEQIAEAGGYVVWQRELHREFGTFVRLWLGPSALAVSIDDPELVLRTAHLADRPQAPLAFFERVVGTRNLQAEVGGKDHKENRKEFARMLSGRGLFRQQYSVLTEFVGRLISRWSSAADSGASVAIEADLHLLSLNIMGAISCGRDFESMGVLERLTESFDYAMMYSFHPAGGDPSRFDEAMVFLRGFMDLLTHDRTAPAPGEACNDILGMMLREGFDAQECRENVLTMWTGAMHTAPIAMAWTLYLLARHPEVAARVSRELDEVLGDAATPRYEDLSRLTYLSQVIKESLRYYSPTFTGRLLEQPLELGGYSIPKGAWLFYSLWGIHNNPAHWPSPERFDPDRFSAASEQKHHPFAFVPFGVGSRRCIGMDFALTEMTLVLASVLRRFTFELAPDHPVEFANRLGLFMCAKSDILATPIKRPLVRPGL